MTAMWDEPDSEAYDDSEASDYDSEGDYDSEETRAARRARARRIALRRRQARLRRPLPTTTARAPTPRQTVAAIRNLDLETKVGEDSLRRALDQSNQRATRATYATVASVAVDQALDSFRNDLGGHDFIRAGLRFAPLLLLSPQRRRPGFEGIMLDPRVIGVAGVAGVVAAGKFRNRRTGIASIDISPRNVRRANGRGQFFAIVRGNNGASLQVPVTFESSDTRILAVRQDGTFPRPTRRGRIKVKATADGFSYETFIDVRR